MEMEYDEQKSKYDERQEKRKKIESKIADKIMIRKMDSEFRFTLNGCISWNVEIDKVLFINNNIETTYIPKNVTHIIFGNNFNQKMDNFIPNNVTHIFIGNNFNQKIKNSIPNQVTHLIFGYHFNQEIKLAFHLV